MKHTGFLKSLKFLKSHLLQQKKSTTTPTYFSSKNEQKTTCNCKDAQGTFKYLYVSEKELTYLLSKKDIKLYAYPCPYEKGWHLTKS
jgi:hypothetical protein